MGGFVRKVVNKVGSVPWEVLAAVFGLIVTLNYAALYYVYFQFYVPFGLSPADVGHTRGKLLEESLLGIVLLPLDEAGRFRGQLLGTLVGALVATAAVCRPARGNLRKTVTDLAATVLVVTVAAYVVLLVYSYASAARLARDLGNDVRREGHIIVSTVRRGGETYRPVLDMRAVPVDVVVKKDAAAPPLTPGCGLLLGRADDHFVVHDVRTDSVVRIPAGDVVVVTHTALRHYEDERLPARCTSDVGNDVG